MPCSDLLEVGQLILLFRLLVCIGRGGFRPAVVLPLMISMTVVVFFGGAHGTLQAGGWLIEALLYGYGSAVATRPTPRQAVASLTGTAAVWPLWNQRCRAVFVLIGCPTFAGEAP